MPSSVEAEAVCGWYHIDEVWNLYVEGTLQMVHVDYIEVDAEADGPDYIVKHYDRAGALLTAVSLDYDDIAPVTRARTADDRPWHI